MTELCNLFSANPSRGCRDRVSCHPLLYNDGLRASLRGVRRGRGARGGLRPGFVKWCHQIIYLPLCLLVSRVGFYQKDWGSTGNKCVFSLACCGPSWGRGNLALAQNFLPSL